MVRSLFGFAGFAVVVLLGLRLLGVAAGLFGAVLKLALMGFVIYLVLRIFFPSTADRVREMVSGKPAASE